MTERPETTPDLVIGSGPAGVAAAAALLERGRRVHMVDIGRTLDPERTAMVARMRLQAPGEWSPTDRAMASAGPAPAKGARSGAPLKRLFGSDVAYAPADDTTLRQDGTKCVLSWARGGLSTVWGASMLPYRDDDLAGWPVAGSELAPHYARIAQLVGLHAPAGDPLAEHWPAYGMPTTPQFSRQARWVFDRMTSRRAHLAEHGLRFGPARLALRQGACRLCQQCLTGCVYDAVYSTNRTLDELGAMPGFRYSGGLRAIAWTESDRGVSVRCVGKDGDHPIVLQGARAFVAAGVLETARLVGMSGSAPQLRLGLAYHPYFLQPAFLGQAFKGVEREALHALSQLYLILHDRQVTPHGVHVQLYTYNPLFAQRLGVLGPLAGIAGRVFLPRLVALQGFLHSSDGARVRMELECDQAADRSHIRIVADSDLHARRVIARALRHLRSASRLTGVWPLPAGGTIGMPGEGNHIGGTFPMSRTPDNGQTDCLGRPHGSSRVHLVDASVLPNLPPTTITFTAMANAHRIAHHAAGLDRSAA